MAAGTLAHLLSALSAECDDLSFRVEDMHHALVGDGGAPRSGTARFIQAAQGIDYVQQHLAALAEFLMTVAEATPSWIEADIDGALSTVRLSDLRDRLAGGEPVASGTPSIQAGELELL